MSDLRTGGVTIIDFGSQYTRLIARRVRDLGVYAEVCYPDTPPEVIDQHQPAGYILSGGPNSVYDPDAPRIPPHILQSGKPILGICYGMQALTQALGGKVGAAQAREYGPSEIERIGESALFEGLDDKLRVWMSHGDRIEAPPPDFLPVARTPNAPFAAIANPSRHIYAVQFHPEVTHTPQGEKIFANFLFNICNCQPTWTSSAFIDDAIARIREQVGDEKVLLALSGGVDSAVVGALIHRAIGERLVCVFVNTGMLRQGEAEEVVRIFGQEHGMNLVAIDATEKFLDALQGQTEPETKRKIIGGLFIDVFAEEARKRSDIRFLAQGTIYPDVIESARGHKTAKTIKTHHNVGGLPDDLHFDLIEPLRDLFKDEVRRVGEALGLPRHIVWRQPFPGPGLAIRCLGDITWERLETLRAADAIFRDELERAGLLYPQDDRPAATSQSFAVLLPVKSVGVMGDNRTYEEVVALRAVTTDDFMTADWARLDYDLLGRVANRIVNEVHGVNRVVYDITSKPPGTIEWE